MFGRLDGRAAKCRRRQEKIAWLEGGSGARGAARNYGNDGKLRLNACRDRRGKSKFFDLEIWTFCDHAVGHVIHSGLEILEIDGDHRFLDVQFAGRTIETGSVPIEDPVCSVAILLDLNDHIALTDGMEPSARDEDAIAALNRGGVEGLFDTALAKQNFELLPSNATLEADVDVGARLRVGEIPHLRLGLAFQSLAHMHGRMDLHR